MQAGKAGSTAPGQGGNALFLSQLRRGSCTRVQVGSARTLTQCRPGTQYPPSVLNVGGHTAQCPSAVWETRPTPNCFKLETLATARCMLGTTAHYPSACREEPPGQMHAGAGPRHYPPQIAPRSSPCSDQHEAAHLGSPQPVVVPEPCSSSLIPSSVPAGATVTAASTSPNTPPKS